MVLMGAISSWICLSLKFKRLSAWIVGIPIIKIPFIGARFPLQSVHLIWSNAPLTSQTTLFLLPCPVFNLMADPNLSSFIDHD